MQFLTILRMFLLQFLFISFHADKKKWRSPGLDFHLSILMCQLTMQLLIHEVMQDCKCSLSGLRIRLTYSRTLIPNGNDNYIKRNPNNSKMRKISKLIFTVHGYELSYHTRMAKDRTSANFNGELNSSGSKYHTLGGGGANFRDPAAFAMGQKLQNGLGGSQQAPDPTPAPASGFSNFPVSKNPSSESGRQYYDISPSGTGENLSSVSNTKKYHSLPDIHHDQHVSDKSSQWYNVTGYESYIRRIIARGVSYTNSGPRSVAPSIFDELSSSNVFGGALSPEMNPPLDSGCFWYSQPSDQFGFNKNSNSERKGLGRVHSISEEAYFVVILEARLLLSFRDCIVKLLKLEEADWLFGQSDGADEELIDCVVAREKILFEAEAREMGLVVRMKILLTTRRQKKLLMILQSWRQVLFITSCSLPNVHQLCFT